MRLNVPDGITKHYYVDESGDPTLFDARGRVIIGKEGCSKFFVLGLLEVDDPLFLGARLSALRTSLLNDSYFSSVPSMQSESGKTAVFFHAKDDIPEVRREVFKVLSQHNLKFFSIVRDKMKLLEHVRKRNETDSDYRYSANEVYDYLARQLFRDRLHQHDFYNVCFAKRGTSHRTAALRSALEAARDNFSQKWGITTNALITVLANQSRNDACLQAVDYFLWALQRFYEKGEDRYLRFLWPQFMLVRDLDNTLRYPYGEYYTQKNPLISAG